MEVLRAAIVLFLPLAALIPGDLEDVAFWLVKVPHMRPAAPRGKEGIVGDLFGQAPIAAHADQEALYPARVLAVEHSGLIVVLLLQAHRDHRPGSPLAWQNNAVITAGSWPPARISGLSQAGPDQAIR